MALLAGGAGRRRLTASAVFIGRRGALMQPRRVRDPLAFALFNPLPPPPPLAPFLASFTRARGFFQGSMTFTWSFYGYPLEVFGFLLFRLTNARPGNSVSLPPLSIQCQAHQFHSALDADYSFFFFIQSKVQVSARKMVQGPGHVGRRTVHLVSRFQTSV